MLGAAELLFSNARYHVEEERDFVYTTEFEDGATTVDWDNAEKQDVSTDDFEKDGAEGAGYADYPATAAQQKAYTGWQKSFGRWVRQNELIKLYRSGKYRLTSEAGETQGEFRVRLQQLANEKRDQAVGKIRKRYATKATTLENRLLRAQQAIDREKQQASKKTLDTAVSFGTAILGAVLGRKKLTSSTAGKFGTAVRNASGSRKEAGDVKRAQQTAAKVREDLAQLETDLSKEVAALDATYDAQGEELKEVLVKAKVSDVHIPTFGLVWVPYRDRGDGRFESVWS